MGEEEREREKQLLHQISVAGCPSRVWKGRGKKKEQKKRKSAKLQDLLKW